MTDIRRVGDTGVHTVEGNIAGSRAARLTKEREKQRLEYEAVKTKIKQQNAVTIITSSSAGGGLGRGMIDANFVSSSSSSSFSGPTQTQLQPVISTIPKENPDEGLTEEERKERTEKRNLEKLKKKRKMTSTLSFDVEEEEVSEETENSGHPEEQKRSNSSSENINEKEEQKILKRKIAKNPDVDTSHLPDRERDRALEETKRRLREDWLQEQEVIKKQMVEVVYSYWDGGGHRRAMEVRKGTTIGKFLEYVKLQLSPEFPEVRGVTSDGFLYIKEDLIIPHHISFYDLIAMKARGKSGPLFHFDVHDDVRLVNDARVEKDESHPGKIVDRRWYEQNKHIFPASRWEVFDPLKQRSADQKYTIHGD